MVRLYFLPEKAVFILDSLQEQYRKLRKNIQAQKRRREKKIGEALPALPKKPKKITEGSIKRLQQYKSKLPTYSQKSKGYIRTGSKGFKIPKIGNLIKGLMEKPKKPKKPKQPKTPKIPSGRDFIPTQAEIILDSNLLDRLSSLKPRTYGATDRQENFATKMHFIIEQAVEKYGKNEVASRLMAQSDKIEKAIEDMENYLLSSDQPDLYEKAEQGFYDLHEALFDELPTLEEAKAMSDLSEDYDSEIPDYIDDEKIIYEDSTVYVVRTDDKQITFDKQTGDVLDFFAI